MKAAFVKRRNKVRIKDIPKPRPGETEVLNRYFYSGLEGRVFCIRI